MTRVLARAIVFSATALAVVLISSTPVRAGHCGCWHMGIEVECPPGVKGDTTSKRVTSTKFVAGGTEWATPEGTKTIPLTEFKRCHPPTATAPAPPGASATTPPPPGPSSTPPSISPPQPPALTQPSETTHPGGQAMQGATPQTVRPGDLGRAQQERARGLIEGEPPQPLIPVSPGPVGPGLPGQSTERETDEAISRLGRLLQQQPPTTPEKPPEPPVPSVLGEQPLLAPSKPPQTPAVAVPAETSRDPSAPEEGPGDDDDLNQQDTLIGDKVEKTPPPVAVSEKKSEDELAELEIKKEQAAEMDPVELGPRRNLIKYTITVTNKGPAAAQNVVVADYMKTPPNPKLWSGSTVKVAKDATSDNSEGTAQITKDAEGGFVSGHFKLPLLAKGAIWTITYQVEPTAAGKIVNGAAFKCDNLKRGWRKAFTLWWVKRDYFLEYKDPRSYYVQDIDKPIRGPFGVPGDGFEWLVDAAFTEVEVVKKP